jgi:hypothetical protein
MKVRLLVLALILLVFSFVQPAAAPRYSGWTGLTHLAAPVNSTFIEQAAVLSKDGQTMYLTSTRPCGPGDTTTDTNLWALQHTPDAASEWSNPECLAINMEGYEDSNAILSRDEHWLYFVSNRPGGQGTAGTLAGRDLWVSYRADVHDANAWGEPINADTINSPVADAGPAYFENDGGFPQLMFTSQRAGTFDLYVADVIGGYQFSAPHAIAELNTNEVEAGPSIRFDGLEMFFFRGPDIFDIFTSIRDTPSDPWSAPVRVDTPVSSEFNEQAPRILSDRTTLLFSSNRTGTLGNLDIWMVTRDKVNGR